MGFQVRLVKYTIDEAVADLSMHIIMVYTNLDDFSLVNC